MGSDRGPAGGYLAEDSLASHYTQHKENDYPCFFLLFYKCIGNGERGHFPRQY